MSSSLGYSRLISVLSLRSRAPVTRFPRSLPPSFPSCRAEPGPSGRTEDMSREARVRREHGGTGRTTEGNDNMSGRP